MVEVINTSVRRLQEIVAEDSISRLLVLIFLGSVSQSIIVFTTFFQSMVDFANGITPSLANPDLLFHIALNLIVIFTYCFTTSISFTPKRIVHPLFVQMITCGIIIIVSLTQYSSDHSTYYQFGTRLTFVIIMNFAVLGLLSWLVAKGLKELIGISGNEDDLEKTSFFIPISKDRIKKILTNEEFCKYWGFVVKENYESLELKNNRNADVKIRIVAYPLKIENDDGYAISLVGYEIKYDSIIHGESAGSIKRIKGEITNNLENNEKNIKENIGENIAQSRAIELALERTKPIIRKISRRNLIIITSLAIFVLGMIYPLSIEIIDLNSYLTLVGTIVVSVLVAVIPTAINAVRHKQ